jgi:hypothetical protein
MRKFKTYNLHYNNIFVDKIQSISKKSLKEHIKDRVTSEIDEWYGLKMSRFTIVELKS